MSRNTLPLLLNKRVFIVKLSRFHIDLMSKNMVLIIMAIMKEQPTDLTEASAPGGYQSHLVFQLTILLRLEVSGCQVVSRRGRSRPSKPPLRGLMAQREATQRHKRSFMSMVRGPYLHIHNQEETIHPNQCVLELTARATGL